MNVVYLLIGIGLLGLVVVDILWTTLWVDGGAGPLSTRVTTWLWHALRAAGGQRSRTLSLAGPIILVVTLLAWVTLLWAGWTLLFASDANALLDTSDKTPVTSWAARIYFVAYAMFTMGNGDFRPVGDLWQIATSLTTASGMLVVTLGVSYVLSVLNAVVQKRSFASGVSVLGDRGDALVRSGWNGKDFHALDPILGNLVPQLSTLVVQHKSYPILHYYHSERRENASVVAVAILDEALTVLSFGIPGEYRPNRVLMENARASIGDYLHTLAEAYIEPAEEVPPPPELHRLRSDGLPTVPDEAFARALTDLEDRRKRLAGVVRADAWTWFSEST